jgi:ABC-type multidrug transport system permease subunit
MKIIRELQHRKQSLITSKLLIVKLDNNLSTLQPMLYLKKEVYDMARKYTSKINKIRTFALSLVFLGFIIMYLGVFFRTNMWVMTIFMMLGMLSIIASTVVYFWIGMLSTKAVQVVCPSCGKPTKILGRVDMCMNCKEPLTLDKDLEGKEFDEDYNRKKMKTD